MRLGPSWDWSSFPGNCVSVMQYHGMERTLGLHELMALVWVWYGLWSTVVHCFVFCFDANEEVHWRKHMFVKSGVTEGLMNEFQHTFGLDSFC